MRNVGAESRKSWKYKKDTGFFYRYMSGHGLDIGYAGYEEGCLPILDTAVGVDAGYPGYDGKTLPFADESQDYVYSSHCLEHIEDYSQALREWYRVLKVGGFMVTVVPHQFLYEKKKELPSKWNEDHKRIYTPASLLWEVERSLVPNSYRVRYLTDNDVGFDYGKTPQEHSSGEYEITLVLEKISLPSWELV